jgi:hypothetical protein
MPDAKLSRHGTRTVAVFSHPNHELAIFGLLQSLRPYLVYLTDGGGHERLEQTRQGLASIGLHEHVYFLDYTEASFYQALLDGNTPFYAAVARRLGEILRSLAPDQVLCDAVEFYNSVHDMVLPLVRAALRESPGAAIFEVPLVYQKHVEPEAYEVQRAALSRRAEQIMWLLAPDQLELKIHARDRIYMNLAAQMGEVLTGIPLHELAVEVVTPASSRLPEPDADRILRYEWRARARLERGEIERCITYAQHYVPLASALF